MGAIIDLFGDIGAGARAKYGARCTILGGDVTIVEEEWSGDWQNTAPFKARVTDWIMLAVRAMIWDLRRAGQREFRDEVLYHVDAVTAIGRSEVIENTWEAFPLYLLIYDELWV